MEGVNNHEVENDINKLSSLKCQSEKAQKDQKSLQHQQFVLGLDKKSFLQQKDMGKYLFLYWIQLDLELYLRNSKHS